MHRTNHILADGLSNYGSRPLGGSRRTLSGVEWRVDSKGFWQCETEQITNVIYKNVVVVGKTFQEYFHDTTGKVYGFQPRRPGFQPRAYSCGICCGQSGAGAGFLRVLRFPLPIFTPPISPQSPSPIIQGWCSRPVVAAVPKVPPR
jgi:hypothetical protein